MKTKITFTIIFCILLIFIAACSNESNEQLEIGLLSNLDAIPFIIAKEQGYFDKNIKLTKFTSASDRDSAFHSGNIDGIAADVLAAVFSRESEVEVYITSLTDGSFTLVAGKDSGINDITELEGKTVAISQNTIIEYTFDKIIEAIGLDSNRISKQAIAQIPARLEMLNAGQVDVALFPEPFAAAALADEAKWLADAEEMGIVSGVMIFKGESGRAKSDLIQKMYEGYDKAVDYINSTDRETYIDYIISELGFPENVKNTVIIPQYRKATLPNEEIITSSVNWLFDRSLIKNKFTYNELVLNDGFY